MDLQRLGLEDLRSMDQRRLVSVATDIREQLFKLRMDVFSVQHERRKLKHGLKISLARVLTVLGEGSRKDSPKSKGAN